MLKIIEPKHQCYYKGRVDLLMGLMRLYQDIPLTTEEQTRATFIVGEDDTSGIYGGAILHQKSVNELQTQLKGIVSTLSPQMEDVWVGTLAFLVEDNKMSSNAGNFTPPQKFYKSLLEKFMEFGNAEDVRFLCLTLNPFEHLRTKNRGFWPYILEVKPQDSLDGLFHGILPLFERKYKSPMYHRPMLQVPMHQVGMAA
jgi:hypothetical protein